MDFKPDEGFDTVTAGETMQEVVLVFVKAPGKIAAHTDI
jgi:hypothetical protein